MRAGKRFLNLFCYTATASVHAAAGEARTTTSVDLSATYLEWASRNFALNGFTGAAHQLVQADVLAWLEHERGTLRSDLRRSADVLQFQAHAMISTCSAIMCGF